MEESLWIIKSSISFTHKWLWLFLENVWCTMLGAIPMTIIGRISVVLAEIAAGALYIHFIKSILPHGQVHNYWVFQGLQGDQNCFSVYFLKCYFHIGFWNVRNYLGGNGKRCYTQEKHTNFVTYGITTIFVASATNTKKNHMAHFAGLVARILCLHKVCISYHG